jgi:hypothetical protein
MKINFKSLVIISLLLAVLLACVSCGGDSPSTVVKKFYKAVEKGDEKAISELATPPDVAKMIVQYLDKAKGQVEDKGTIVKATETITGDTAVVTLTFKDGSTDTENCVKVDGKWKVKIDLGGK